MQEPYWQFPNNILSAFRCTEVQYANEFLKNGSIKFNSPNNWVKYAKERTEGRGDLLEGIFAYYNIADIENMVKINKKYEAYDKKNQLIRERIGDKIYLRLNRSMELPCYCFYLLSMDKFPCPKNTGEIFIEHTIPPSYFRDFADLKTMKQAKLLPLEKQPSLIWITNFDEFKKRIINALCSLGVKKEEILIERVRYIDYNKYFWIDFLNNPPMELLSKSSRFYHQNEGRIVVNTNNERIKQRLLNEPISIGRMSDISQKFDKYCYEGVKIKLKADIETYELS